VLRKAVGWSAKSPCFRGLAEVKNRDFQLSIPKNRKMEKSEKIFGREAFEIIGKLAKYGISDQNNTQLFLTVNDKAIVGKHNVPIGTRR